MYCTTLTFPRSPGGVEHCLLPPRWSPVMLTVLNNWWNVSSLNCRLALVAGDARKTSDDISLTLVESCSHDHGEHGRHPVDTDRQNEQTDRSATVCCVNAERSETLWLQIAQLCEWWHVLTLPWVLLVQHNTSRNKPRPVTVYFTFVSVFKTSYGLLSTSRNPLNLAKLSPRLWFTKVFFKPKNLFLLPPAPAKKTKTKKTTSWHWSFGSIGKSSAICIRRPCKSPRLEFTLMNLVLIGLH